MTYRFILLLLFVFALLAAPLNAAEKTKTVPAAPKEATRAPSGLANKKIAANSILIEFPGRHKGKPITSGGFLLLPPGKDKVPVMVIVHGSGGVSKEHEYWYAEELNKMGVAAFILDCYTPRGVATTYDDQSLVSATKDMTNDALMALRALSKNDRIDIQRAGIVGFSKGGIVATLTALPMWGFQFPAYSADLKYKLHVMFYPGCATQPFDLRTTAMPMLMLLAENDTYTGKESCLKLADKMKKGGAHINTIVYPSVTHAWDTNGPWSHPKAEVFKNCVFEQQKNGTWTESFSNTADIRTDLGGDNYAKALKACLTYGVKGEGHPMTKAKSMEEFKRIVKEVLIMGK